MDISLVGHTYKDVVLSRDKYGDGSLAVTLNDKDGWPVAVVSLWLPWPPADGCIWVKGYSENAGILEALVAEGLLETTGRSKSTEFVTLQEARVLA